MSIQVTRQTHTFDQRVMLLMHEWFPERSETSLRSTVNGLYMLENYDPNQGEPYPVVENLIVRHLVTYRSIR